MTQRFRTRNAYLPVAVQISPSRVSPASGQRDVHPPNCSSVCSRAAQVASMATPKGKSEAKPLQQASVPLGYSAPAPTPSGDTDPRPLSSRANKRLAIDRLPLHTRDSHRPFLLNVRPREPQRPYGRGSPRPCPPMGVHSSTSARNWSLTWTQSQRAQLSSRFSSSQHTGKQTYSMAAARTTFVVSVV